MSNDTPVLDLEYPRMGGRIARHDPKRKAASLPDLRGVEVYVLGVDGQVGT